MEAARHTALSLITRYEASASSASRHWPKPLPKSETPMTAKASITRKVMRMRVATWGTAKSSARGFG